MKNSIADLVASQMELNLRGSNLAGLTATANKEECSVCKKADCSCADDANAAKDSKEDDKSDMSSADDGATADENDAKDMSSEDSKKESTAFDLAIFNFLKASEALEVVGMEKTADLSLQLAGFVVEAKKKKMDSKKKKKSDKKSDSKSKSKSKSSDSKSSKSKK